MIWAELDASRANDLPGYRALWHADFLGWPHISPEPLRKDQATDWATVQINQGEIPRTYVLEEVCIQVTGDIATAAYRIREGWSDKSGAAHRSVFRVIHTWLRDPAGSWQIISGMSAPTDPDGH